jgi:hypothetical protein
MKTIVHKFVLSCLLLSASLQGTTQNNASASAMDYDTKKSFLKSTQIRFIENMRHAGAVLLTESARIGQLQKLNDSLLSIGDISDPVSRQVQEKLLAQRKGNDSLQRITLVYAGLLSSFPVYKKQYAIVSKSVPLFYQYLLLAAPKTNGLLLALEKELYGSNLALEKKQLKTMLNNAAAQQEKEAAKVGELGNTKTASLSTGAIDDSTAINIDKRLSRYQARMDSINNEIKDLENRLAAPKDYSVNGAIIKSRIILIDSIVNKGAAVRQYTFNMIEEGLKKSTKTLFSLAAFFGPGGYKIPETKQMQARKYFSPVIDSLIKFSNQFADIPRDATILVNGYADGTQIQPGTALYKELVKYLQYANPTKEQLNAGLSALRAEELSKLFARIISERSNEFISLPVITFENIEIGRGEQYPDPLIKNYKVNDERRRIVIVYWSVLPNR